MCAVLAVVIIFVLNSLFHLLSKRHLTGLLFKPEDKPL